MLWSWILPLLFAPPGLATVQSYYPCVNKAEEGIYVCSIDNGGGATIAIAANANVNCVSVMLETESGLECHVTTGTTAEGNPAPPPPTSTVVEVETQTRKAEETRISHEATTAPSSQIGTQKAAAGVAHLGASNAATIGALYCAEGAVKVHEDDKSATESLAKCQQKFESAEKLAAMEAKQKGKPATIEPDATVLKEAGAKGTLDRFETAFGVAPSDYLNTVIGSGASMASAPGRMRDLIADKVPADKLDAVFAEAEKAYQAEAASARATPMGAYEMGVLGATAGVPEFPVSSAPSFPVSSAPSAAPLPSAPTRHYDGSASLSGAVPAARAGSARPAEARRPASEAKRADLKNLSANTAEFFSGIEPDPESSLFLRVRKKLRSRESYLVNRRR